jgi:hypothetical protein
MSRGNGGRGKPDRCYFPAIDRQPSISPAKSCRVSPANETTQTNTPARVVYLRRQYVVHNIRLTSQASAAITDNTQNRLTNYERFTHDFLTIGVPIRCYLLQKSRFSRSMLQPILHRLPHNFDDSCGRVTTADEFRDRNHRLWESRGKRYRRLTVGGFSPAAWLAGGFGFGFSLCHWVNPKKSPARRVPTKSRSRLLRPGPDWRGNLACQLAL